MRFKSGSVLGSAVAPTLTLFKSTSTTLLHKTLLRANQKRTALIFVFGIWVASRPTPHLVMIQSKEYAFEVHWSMSIAHLLRSVRWSTNIRVFIAALIIVTNCNWFGFATNNWISFLSHTSTPQAYRAYAGNFRKLTDIVRCCLVVETSEDMIKLVQVRCFHQRVCLHRSPVIVLHRKSWITANIATEKNLLFCKECRRFGKRRLLKNFWVWSPFLELLMREKILTRTKAHSSCFEYALCFLPTPSLTIFVQFEKEYWIPVP